MLIRYFIELPVPYNELANALVGSPEAWIPGLVGEASDRGERLLIEVGFGGRLRVSKRVEVSIGDPRLLGAALYLPVSWQATGPSGLFPVLEETLSWLPWARAGRNSPSAHATRPPWTVSALWPTVPSFTALPSRPSRPSSIRWASDSSRALVQEPALVPIEP